MPELVASRSGRRHSRATPRHFQMGGLNLSLVMRQLLGRGTPRGLQGLSAESLLLLLQLWIVVLVRIDLESASHRCSGLCMPRASNFSLPSRAE